LQKKNDIVPLEVQQDIDFLKQSWANMAELEDTQQENPFQPVLSKSQKKAKKKKAQQNPYTTRSRVGHFNSAQ
jgi:hypothetical protein